MAVRTKDEILEIIRKRIGGDNSDETIEFLEDVTDTLDEYERNSSNDWEQKYYDLDKSWREKYKSRFFSKEVEIPVEKEEFEEKKLSYEELFKEEK